MERFSVKALPLRRFLLHSWAFWSTLQYAPLEKVLGSFQRYLILHHCHHFWWSCPSCASCCPLWQILALSDPLFLVPRFLEWIPLATTRDSSVKEMPETREISTSSSFSSWTVVCKQTCSCCSLQIWPSLSSLLRQQEHQSLKSKSHRCSPSWSPVLLFAWCQRTFWVWANSDQFWALQRHSPHCSSDKRLSKTYSTVLSLLFLQSAAWVAWAR